jgi:hypothetical protein
LADLQENILKNLLVLFRENMTVGPCYKQFNLCFISVTIHSILYVLTGLFLLFASFSLLFNSCYQLPTATMVFTNAQTTAFFEDALQMGIPNATRLQLVTEGIVNVQDLEEFDEANLKQITENMRRPPGRVPVDPAHPLGPSIPTPPFEFGAKSIIRLKAASDIVRYYQTTGRTLTAPNMKWDRSCDQVLCRTLESPEG